MFPNQNCQSVTVVLLIFYQILNFLNLMQLLDLSIIPNK